MPPNDSQRKPNTRQSKRNRQPRSKTLSCYEFLVFSARDFAKNHIVCIMSHASYSVIYFIELPLRAILRVLSLFPRLLKLGIRCIAI